MGNKITTLYYLFEYVEKVLGQKDGKEITRTDRLVLGVFTTPEKRTEYRDNFKTPDNHKYFEENEELTDKEVGETFNNSKVDPIIEIQHDETNSTTSQEE